MKSISNWILVGLLVAVSIPVSAQEIIMPLSSNSKLGRSTELIQKKAIQTDTLEIPFIDDFFHDSPYPDPALWSDNYAFINNGFAVNPPSFGVATLDALDSDGSVYPFASISPQTFNADSLTSQPINLDYPAADSIYLSFFYQPQGTGLEPGEGDSLCLDFFDFELEKWINVWRTPGDTVRAFKQVMIPIKDARYLKKGFRFSFRNRASLPKNRDYLDKRGNVDHWNIDYVRLDRNRSIKDTVIRDVAVYKSLPSMLIGYQTIPWDHFEKGYNTIYRPFVSINYFNNDTAIRNVTRVMEVYDEVWNELYNPNVASAQDIFPGVPITYDISNVYPFKFNRGDTASYLIKAWLRTDDFDYKSNDTIYRRQVFRDYFAYDDASAERAYGLRGQGTNNGLIAVRFNSFIADELGGVDIYFAQLKDSINLDYYFKFMVWDDIQGFPGDLIYEDELEHSAVYSDMINGYKRFHFKQPVAVEGPFFVGILQYNQYLLNIGMDINNPANGKLFYNLGSEWMQSSAPGSLMLRPFVERYYSTTASRGNLIREIAVWPNPANDFIRYEIPDDIDLNSLEISLFDITGKQISSIQQYNNEVYTGDLPEGIYLISFRSPNRLYKAKKIIISR